ncbi:MAG TPA: phosphoglycerate kinase, partial [Acidimicrobiaceae bacterium]|nr:phosphoglycerate kinase [Acidimicrobiaceae bacterium]
PVDTRAVSPGGTLGHGQEGQGEVQVFAGDLPEGWEGADIGPATVTLFE